jgi:hypothetical protein
LPSRRKLYQPYFKELLFAQASSISTTKNRKMARELGIGHQDSTHYTAQTGQFALL